MKYNSEWQEAKNMQGGCCTLFTAVTQQFPGETEKSQKLSVRNVIQVKVQIFTSQTQLQHVSTSVT
jgi:hypothetical protein